MNPFFETIYQLRNKEQMILSGRPVPPDPEEEQDVTDFLETEWDNECLEYPGVPPAFDAPAAVWAARLIYTAAQLLLYRSHAATAIPELIRSYEGPVTTGAMLSADLCLRFLPVIINNLRLIDPDDLLTPALEAQLQTWHYSGIGTKATPENSDFTAILADPCALQLYADRVILYKDNRRAALPFLSPVINASLGDFGQLFWKEKTQL